MSLLGRILEFISVFPLEYICILITKNYEWLRLFRLLKMISLSKVGTKIKTWFGSYYIYNIVRLIWIFISSCHVIGCILFALSKYEFENGGRFDGASFVFVYISIVHKYTTIICQFQANGRRNYFQSIYPQFLHVNKHNGKQYWRRRCTLHTF